jgi:tetratricopeptide (TPR) repeat protein
MATGRSFVVIALAVGAAAFLTVQLVRRLSPIRRALGRARKGDINQAMANLRRLVEQRPASADLHGALGQIYLMGKRLEEAEAELRQALELGSRNPLDMAALGWALVRQGRFEEALPIAEEAQQRAHEDFGVYCLYCGLMAHHGRGAEMSQLFEFLKRSSVQIQRLNPKAYDDELGEQFAFARSEMRGAGFV